MKKFLYVIAMVLCAITLLYSLPSTAQADPIPSTLIQLITTVQADESADQPVVQRPSWGQLKVLYGPEPKTAETPDQASASGIQKPGAGLYGGTYANQQWWRGLPQNYRNEYICTEAFSEMVALGGGVDQFSRPSGYNCKTWANHVVSVASRGVASLPASSSWCRWYSGTYVTVAGYGPSGVNIRGAARGNIVQASWGKYPHTMIVWLMGGSGLYVIDCNMDLRGGLKIHYISFADFENKSGGCYTVYQVIGG